MLSRVIRLLALSFLVGAPSCSLFSPDIPCLADRNCPPDAPFCVDGLCKRARAAEGEGEGKGAPKSFEAVALGSADVGIGVENAVFLELSDGIAFAFDSQRDSFGSDVEVRYGELHAAGAIATEVVVPTGNPERTVSLTASDGGAPLLTTIGEGGGATDGARTRSAPGTWSSKVPLPPNGLQGPVVAAGGVLYAGSSTDNTGLITDLQSSPADGSAWAEVTSSFESCNMFVCAANGHVFAIFDIQRQGVGADFTSGAVAASSLPSPNDSATPFEAVDDLHCGLDARALAVGVDANGTPLLWDVGNPATAPIDLVAKNVAASGDGVARVTSDADGHVHLLVLHKVGATGHDLIYVTDASRAFASERVTSTSATFFELGLAVDLNRDVFVGLRESDVDASGAISKTSLTIFRRTP
jgi:hypothetical protein